MSSINYLSTSPRTENKEFNRSATDISSLPHATVTQPLPFFGQNYIIKYSLNSLLKGLKNSPSFTISLHGG